MDKRERLEKTFAGEPVDRPPVALWRHFPGDDQRAADLSRAVVLFQRTYDWDFVKVTPASSYCVADYGVQDEWRGNLEGTRVRTKFPVQRSLDWTELRTLDPLRGALAKHINCLELVGEGVGEETPIIATIFNPLAQAREIAGHDRLLEHMRTQPDRLKSGLNTITESILRFLDALQRTPIAGIFYAVQHASYGLMSEAEYMEFGLPYDQKILSAISPDWWFNMLHLHGALPMFRLLADMPVQAVNWHDQDTDPDLSTGKATLKGAACGGLSQKEVNLGTPADIRASARSAMTTTNGRRFILSTGCVSMITSPHSNLRAVRESVEPTVL